jgi:hypothetical protein
VGWLGVAVIISTTLVHASPALGCAGGNHDPTAGPLAIIHFWYPLNGWSYYGSYSFDCDGNMTGFCPSDSFIGPSSGPMDGTARDPGYYDPGYCNGTATVDQDHDWGPTCPTSGGGGGGGGGSCNSRGPGSGGSGGGPGGLGGPAGPFGENPGMVGQPINLTTGNMYHRQTDLSLPGRRGGLTFTRTYNSRAGYLYHGVLGFGWSHTYDIRLEAVSTGVSGGGVIIGAIYRIRMHMGDGRGAYFLLMPDGLYHGQYGDLTTMVKNPDGSFTATFPQDGV